jgi:cobalt/nickel transport system ATP-binding protein
MDELIFELKEVYFSYLGRYPALCGVDIKIKKGQRIAVIGANGTGKSTLLQMLDGLIFADKGEVLAFGRRMTEEAFNDPQFIKGFRGRVGLVFQNSDIQLFCPTVKEDIVFGPLQLGVEKNEINRRLEKLVAVLQVQDLLDRPPYQLSMGEKRKVAIASTLAIEPEVLILDEPTAGLDPSTCRHIIDIMLQANSEGKTIITATQDLHILEEIADQVCVFGHNRRVIACGTPSELLADTKFLSENNLIHIHAHRHKEEVHVHPHQHLEHHG